jgi:hypothetical protein
MKLTLNKEQLELLNSFFGCNAEVYETSYIWTIVNQDAGDFLILTIYSKDENEATKSPNIINVQTHQGYFELHNSTDYFIFQPDEIFFWSIENKKISCIVIGKSATCSLFSNIDENIFDIKPENLPSSQLLAALQLSLINSFD